MFVRNRENIDFKYWTSGKCILLKASTVTFVDESIVSAKKLKDCFGQRIEIINQATNNSEAHKEAVISEVKKAQVQPVADNENIDNILSQIEEELKLNEDKAAPTVEDALNENKEIKDFLEGETDNLPEGTEEINDDEFLKLLVQAGIGDEVNVNPPVNNTNEVNKAPADNKKVVNKNSTKPVKKTQAKTGRGKKTAKK